uniref:Uncharacterized protein n=1 Tax=Lygus hesperus TaxID=30085 RepID=A0A146LII6_LYGHE
MYSSCRRFVYGGHCCYLYPWAVTAACWCSVILPIIFSTNFTSTGTAVSTPSLLYICAYPVSSSDVFTVFTLSILLDSSYTYPCILSYISLYFRSIVICSDRYYSSTDVIVPR